RTRRKAFHLASNAAIEEATPTFNSRVKRSSRIGGIVSIARLQPWAYASQLPLYRKEAAGENGDLRGGSAAPCYTGVLLWPQNRPRRRASESPGNRHGWWRAPICRRASAASPFMDSPEAGRRRKPWRWFAATRAGELPRWCA